MIRRDRRFLYYARPTFLEGLARIMDFGNSLNQYPRFRTAREADAFALRSDWIMVGQDISEAICEFEKTKMDDLTPVS